MNELLLLAHRIPYPPDKGDKIRSWNFLKHLARRYDVYLGCFVDDARDWQFTESLREICKECCFVELRPAAARRRSLWGLLDGRPLTLPYYLDPGLRAWVGQVLERPSLERVFVYCGAMAQYVPEAHRRGRRVVVDLVDLDSEKWLDYARGMAPWRAWVYRREGQRLRAVEQRIAASCEATLLATEAEVADFRRLAPDIAARVLCVANGVDADYFSPDRGYATPFEPGIVPLVFTGAMDYWPNIDAVAHFVQDILPLVTARMPNARFFIVGSKPAPEVMALAHERSVIVTGRVPDTRPYLAHARAVVAPLRIARGVQNKVLEGMAMARPVVGSPAAVLGIEGESGREFLVAQSPPAFAEAIAQTLDASVATMLGERARRRVLADHSWQASQARLEALLDGSLQAAA